MLMLEAMKTLQALVAGLLAIAPARAHADDKAPTTTASVRDARLVSFKSGGKFAGWKVYVVRAGGRFDQPSAKFINGDVIEEVDGVAVVEAETNAVYDKIVVGTADTVITVRRQGKPLKLTSKAK